MSSPPSLICVQEARGSLCCSSQLTHKALANCNLASCHLLGRVEAVKQTINKFRFGTYISLGFLRSQPTPACNKKFSQQVESCTPPYFYQVTNVCLHYKTISCSTLGVNVSKLDLTSSCVCSGLASASSLSLVIC